MRSVIKLFILLIFLAIPSSGWPCKPLAAEFGKSEIELVRDTKTIVVAQAIRAIPETDLTESMGHNLKKKFTYELRVVRTLKGKAPKKIKVEHFDPPGSDNSQRGYRLDCEFHGDFQIGKQYLIFVDSAHPRGYQPLSNSQDPWLGQVENLLTKSFQK